MDREALRALIIQRRAEQGLPRYVEDPAVLDRLADLLLDAEEQAS